MKINEIFFSIQGESTLIGVPTLFIRTYGCNLKCSYCDTVYARGDLPESKGIMMEQDLGKGETAEFEVEVPIEELPYDVMTVDEIIECIKPDLAGLDKHNAFISITGGEPLLQDRTELKHLCHQLQKLMNNNAVISIETNGSMPIPFHLPNVYWIVDIKTPGSGVEMTDEKIAELIRSMQTSDELKFVIMGEKDYNWAKDIVYRFAPTDMLNNRNVLFSPVKLPVNTNWPRELAEMISRDKLPVRFQLQLHKVIWPDVERGV